ncbi:DNA alkylation repair protein [Kordiimonas aestuarii]|uniref:DNA alkylation repair protein n=1 Tax=Kordiimonas aestuarii TaxID=1005925 RepID=UPI0021D2E264|nr:DNA alkylation repair protein [Kordiimonas aestuarii]
MAPLKNYFNQDVIRQTAAIFGRVDPGFDAVQFTEIAGAGLDGLELKERVIQIMHALDATLPDDFDAFTECVLASMHKSEDPSGEGLSFDGSGLTGFAAWPVTELVSKRGLDVPERALPLLKEVTKRFTAEFAIRPFLVTHRDYTLSVLNGWVEDRSRHVRRLVSEGTRPRLPWGMRLHDFVADPQPILPFLEALRDDGEDYVRRSVANSLNDVAKDHPDRVGKIVAKWLPGANPDRERLLRHACRTLIKAGHKPTLDAFGYGAMDGLSCTLAIKTPTVAYGQSLEFEVELDGDVTGRPLMLDYAIHFVKANGERTPKVFKWKDAKVNGRGLRAAKRHAIKPITTRRYYGGEHLLEIWANGRSVASAAFTLVIPG